MALNFVSPAAITVTTAGTAVPLSSASGETEVHILYVHALASNTNGVWIGDSNVAANRGIELAPGDTYEFRGLNNNGFSDGLILQDIYVDADTNANKVAIVYQQRTD